MKLPTYEKIMTLKYYQVDSLLTNKSPGLLQVYICLPSAPTRQEEILLHLKSQKKKIKNKISGHQCSPFRGSAHKKKKGRGVTRGSASGMKHGKGKEQRQATSDSSLN